MKLPGPIPTSSPTQPPRAGSSLPATGQTRPGAATDPATAGSSVPDAARQALDQLRLRDGETALARVVDVLNRKGAAPELLLELRNRPLQVQAPGNLPDGAALKANDWLTVMRAGNELRLMGRLAEPPEAMLSRALIQKLPWQQSLGSGLQALARALSTGIRPDPSPGQLPSMTPPRPLPEAARQALAEVLSRAPSPAVLQPGAGRSDTAPTRIRQWFSDSGLFAEHRLTRAPELPPADLKLALMRAITALLDSQGQLTSAFTRIVPAQSPDLLSAPLQFPLTQTATAAPQDGDSTTVGQTLKLLAGMLNRISVNQLHSQVLTARAGGDNTAPTATVLLELPWVNAQQEPRTAQLRLEQYDSDKNGASAKARKAVSEWRLALRIDLDDAGPMHFDVSLSATSVGAQVWAARQSTLRRVNEQLPLLRRSLVDLGLEVTGLESRLGLPKGPETRLEHRLVDTRA